MKLTVKNVDFLTSDAAHKTFKRYIKFGAV